MPETKNAPNDIPGILKQLGPGLIVSAAVVGSGELIVTTKLGADVGFTLLWFILFGCLIKVFLQVELGRYTISRGKTSLEALNSIPGPRAGVSWLVWLWAMMFFATFFQLSGMVGGIAQVAGLAGIKLPDVTLAILITGSCALLLYIGRYAFIELFSTLAVACFTVFTIFAVFSLYWTEYGVTFAQLREGLSFQLPDQFVIAFAAFGVIGVGAAELIFYPYWCLEKGYARYVGKEDGSDEWAERAKGWIKVLKWDAFVSMAIYTLATVAFYLLGAAVLNGKNLDVTNDNLMVNLSMLYQTSFGIAGLWFFVFGALVVLYSTIFISTASNTRLVTDLFYLLGLIKLRNEVEKKRAIQIASICLPALYCVFYLLIGKPITLVAIGAVAQALMLPFLSVAALYFLYKKTHAFLRPGIIWVIFLWVSAMLMAMVGIYQFMQEIQKFI